VASLVWLASVVLTLIIPQLCALPYVVAHYRGLAGGPTKETLLSDKTFVLLLVIGLFVAHLITLILAWAVVTRLGKLSFKKTLGLSWPVNLGAVKSIGLAVLLFMIAMVILKLFGGQENDLQRILNSSRAAALVVAFIAAATAPLIEEVVYRGLLYSALQRLAGPIIGVIVVTSVFAGLHVLQYWPDGGAIASISLLSLVLTAIRARTGKLLPCYVIHLVFNGIQSVLIVAEPYLRALYETWRQKPSTGLLHILFTPF
jgi:membrane protease YdiL (CAAX protease family)